MGRKEADQCPHTTLLLDLSKGQNERGDLVDYGGRVFPSVKNVEAGTGLRAYCSECGHFVGWLKVVVGA